jgi:fluoride ion exporter CrcB/FEX
MSGFFFWVVVLCFVAGFVLSFLNISRSAQRHIYWTCVCVAGVCGTLSTYPTWDNAVALGIFPVATMAAMAYVSTPYIKIGGKIYALTISAQRADPDSAPDAENVSPARETDSTPDSYSGLLTAATMWWMLVVIAVIAAANVYGFAAGKGPAWVAVMMATFLALLAVGTGYGDASWHYPVARRQFVQFGVASVITAGSFALVYLTAYCIARRRPLRREQSMEHIAHPRHGKRQR